MNTKMKLTIDLSPVEIKEAIIKYIRSNAVMSGISVTTSDVEFITSSSQASIVGAKIEAQAEPLPRSTSYWDR